MDAERVGALIGSIGKYTFDQAFFSLVQSQLDVSACTALSYVRKRPPLPIVLAGSSAELQAAVRLFGTEYSNRAYLKDKELAHLAAIGPDEHEVEGPQSIDSIGYLAALRDYAGPVSRLVLLAGASDCHFSLALYRSGSGATFDDVDRQRLCELAAVSIPAFRLHLTSRNVGSACERRGSGATTDDSIEHLVQVLLHADSGLTPREALVCASIVLGYQSVAISLRLGISVNTVLTHRKRAYAKLGVSSQTELFGRYFRTVREVGLLG